MHPPVNVAISAENMERIQLLGNLKVERFRTGVCPFSGPGSRRRKINLHAAVPKQNAFCRSAGSTDHLVITGKTFYNEEVTIRCTFLSLEQVQKIEAFLASINEQHGGIAVYFSHSGPMNIRTKKILAEENTNIKGPPF